MELATSVMQLGARSDRPVGEHPSRQWSSETTLEIFPEILKCPIHIAVKRGHVKIVDLSLFSFIGHPSCLRYSDKLVEKIKTIRWQCLDCKRCIICSIGDPGRKIRAGSGRKAPEVTGTWKQYSNRKIFGFFPMISDRFLLESTGN